MESKKKLYLLAVLAHLLIGVTVYYLPVVSKVYGIGMLVFGFFYVIRSRNENHEVLYVCSYIIGSEVLLRMTGGNPVYEFSKYAVVFFILMGMFYKGFSKFAVPYWIFLVLLVPGVVISTQVLDFDAELRKSISFNISGPLCLGISSLYTYNRRISFDQLNRMLLIMGLPIISVTVYTILYAPSVREVITNTSSSFETSGGFGPNQVSTILGLGMFIFFSRLMLYSKSKIIFLVNLFLFLVMSYRGLVTFSRGGVLTAICMMVMFLIVVYGKLNTGGRSKLQKLVFLFVIVFSGIWIYSTNETGGLIQKRYSNQDAAGRVKQTRLSGREDIMSSEIQFFMDNPIFGIGVARGTELRAEADGNIVLSHNEITRMLSEHGGMGILALVILFFTPLFLYLDNRAHFYLLCFLCFWLLTINHAAMRLAAPAFVYSLSILKVFRDEAPLVHRE